jgi:hypothetical protein
METKRTIAVDSPFRTTYADSPLLSRGPSQSLTNRTNYEQRADLSGLLRSGWIVDKIVEQKKVSSRQASSQDILIVYLSKRDSLIRMIIPQTS